MKKTDQLNVSPAMKLSPPRNASKSSISGPTNPERDIEKKSVWLLNIKKILLTVISLVLFYFIAAYSVPSGLSRSKSKLALSLNESNPNAAIDYAHQKIVEEADRRRCEITTSADRAAAVAPIKKLLQRAISVGPINPTAFQMLAQIAILDGDIKTARRLMAEAANLSLGESQAISFLLRESLSAKNTSAALAYADILMRYDIGSFNEVTDIVAHMAENREAHRELIKRLAASPPWRSRFLQSIAASGLTNLGPPLEFLVALKGTPNPPTEAELASYIGLLVRNGYYNIAYSAWLEFLDADRLKDVSHLVNGSFERQPSGAPFDWTIVNNKSTRAGIFAHPDDESQSALLIQFTRVRSDFPIVRQMVLLSPGVYRFTGRLKGELRARRGLQWSVICLGSASPSESQMFVGRFPSWTAFDFEVQIPEKDCPAQFVQLRHMARSPSEQFAAGEVWFDDLAITRESPPVAHP